MGEVWQYMGTVAAPSAFRHEFRHRAHPLFAQGRVNAEVYDDDGGPRLGRLVIMRWLSAADDGLEEGEDGEL